jgi:thiol-disulfide isomerase/thioredoxin
MRVFFDDANIHILYEKSLSLEEMKRIFILLPLFIMLLSCNQRHYRIDGIFTTDDGTPVWLVDINAQDTLAETAVNDNSFHFEGKVKEPFYAYVGNGKQRVHCILEPGIIKADIDGRIASGTPMEDAYMAFHRRFYGYGRDQKEEKTALADSVVLSNRDNLVGALALEDLSYVNPERFLELYNQLPEKNQAFYLVQSALESIQIQQRTAPGQPFTDYFIAGGNPDGSDVRLSDYVGRGKYILLDHWASWCVPCKGEIPYIRKTWEAFHGERFDVVSIAVSDRREDTEKALRELDMPWNQILDGQRIPLELYGVSAIPHLILFGPDGTILRRGLRGDGIYDAVAELF